MSRDRHHNSPQTTYNAKPLVVHRAKPVSTAQIISRKTRIARKRLNRQFFSAGTNPNTGIKHVHRLIDTVNNSQTNVAIMKNATNCAIYVKISKEIINSIDAGGGLDAFNDDIDRLMQGKEKPLLTRDEKIKMHAINAAAVQKQKEGGVPPPIVSYTPPVPSSTLLRLQQLNEAEKKLPKHLQKKEHPKIVPSKEMEQALKQQIYGLSSKFQSKRSSNNRNNSSNNRNNRNNRNRNKNRNRKRNKDGNRNEKNNSKSRRKSNNNTSIEENDDLTLNTDFWENRLTSTLARPLGIEALIQSRSIPTPDGSNTNFVSDHPELDANQYRYVDQEHPTKVALATGKPVLNKDVSIGWCVEWCLTVADCCCNLSCFQLFCCQDGFVFY